MEHYYFMKKAIEQAQASLLYDEVPIGCVIVMGDEIIATGQNMRNSGKNALYHAEILAIDQACKKIGDWRLEDCSMYVTVEPCPMCAGAIVTARMKRLVFGTRNPKAGCCGSILNILNTAEFNHQVEIVEGVLQEECAQLMSDFFKRMRTKKIEG